MGFVLAMLSRKPVLLHYIGLITVVLYSRRFRLVGNSNLHYRTWALLPSSILCNSTSVHGVVGLLA